MRPSTYVSGFHDDAAAPLAYSRLGNTDMEVSFLGIGGCSAGGLYGAVAEEESVQTLVEAVRAGVNYVDTAPYYGDSERVVGEALKKIPRAAYYLATKVGRFPGKWSEQFDFSAKRTEDTVNRSLQRLGVSCIDLIQVHDVEFCHDVDIIVNETLPTLQKMKEQGKARYIGITGYSLKVLTEVLEKSSTKIDCVLSYARNTLVNQDLREYLPKFQARGLGVVNASITSMNLLTPGPAPAWHPASAAIKETADRMNALCQSSGVNMARLAVRYSSDTPGVGVHLLGCNTRDILRLNLAACTTPFSDAEKQLVNTIVSEFGKQQTHWEGVEIAEMKKAL